MQTWAIYNVLLLGLRDYVHKNRFPGVVIGMSVGSIQPFQRQLLDALGPEKVWCVMMPSPTQVPRAYDAAECCKLLGVRLI